VAINNNPAIRPPKAGDLDKDGQILGDTSGIVATGDPFGGGSDTSGKDVIATGDPRSVEPIGGLQNTSPANIDPRMPLDPVTMPTGGDIWQPPGGEGGDPQPDNPYNLPALETPTMGSDLDVETPVGGGGVAEDMLQQFASGAMTDPSRYDIPMVQQGMDLINTDLERRQSYGQADLDELMSSRGLVGSNVEADAHANLIGRLNQSRQQQYFDLARDMATTQAQDRMAAGQLGVQAGQFSEQIAGRLQQESQFARSLTSSDARAAMDYGLQERAQQLQATGMAQDEAYRQAAMEMEEGLRTRALDLQQQGMDEEKAYRYAALEQDARFRQSVIDMQQQGMDLDEAYRYAEMDLREREMEQNRQMEVLSILLSAMSGLDEGELSDIMGGLFETSGAIPSKPEWFTGTDEQWEEAYSSGQGLGYQG
jgi:hypothetical protein